MASINQLENISNDIISDSDTKSENNDEPQMLHTSTIKFDLYNNPEYNAAIADAEQFENSAIADYYKNNFCLKAFGEYKIRENTLKNHYKNIEPFVYNSFDDVKNHRKQHLCVLIKGHTGKCCDKPALFKKHNKIAERLVGSVDLCIYHSPGNDDYVYKNRSSRLHPIHIPKTIERQIRNKNKKLKCAIPTCEYSTPFMLATAYIDWLCYIINIQDINDIVNSELNETQQQFINILKNDHKTFLSNYFSQLNRKVFDENNNTICAIAKTVVMTKHVSDPTRDNRIEIDPDDIQMGHIKSRNDNYFSVRGTNIVMMTRYGNRIIGEDSFTENVWIEKLKKIVNQY